jgi:hypothetical protein
MSNSCALVVVREFSDTQLQAGATVEQEAAATEKVIQCRRCPRTPGMTVTMANIDNLVLSANGPEPAFDQFIVLRCRDEAAAKAWMLANRDKVIGSKVYFFDKPIDTEPV